MSQEKIEILENEDDAPPINPEALEKLREHQDDLKMAIEGAENNTGLYYKLGRVLRDVIGDDITIIKDGEDFEIADKHKTAIKKLLEIIIDVYYT